jgi:formate dehydrogenase maturation protein FdhE
MAAREAPPTTGAVIATDLGVCPHCERSDGVERYMLDEDTPTSARYCSHCETRWRGKREAKAAAA